MADARVLNWRFVTPMAPSGALFLPAGGESLEDVVTPRDAGELRSALERSFPAVIVPDLARWVGRITGEGRSALERLAERVEPNGWVGVGVRNPSFPAAPLASGSVRLSTARDVLRARGYDEPDVYLAFPDVGCPAFLVPDSGAELGYFVRELSIPYVPSGGWRALVKQVALRVMRSGAIVAPHRARVALAPGAFLVGRRRSA